MNEVKANGLVSYALKNGGLIRPLIVPNKDTDGTGLMNPSVFIDNGKILVNLRHVNYTIYHSENKKFPHQWGPLLYLHPEDDLTLRTNNFILELDDSLNIKNHYKVDMKFNKEPLWNFVGLEDARLFRWEGKLYLCGVRRDHLDATGRGRMDLSEIDFDGNTYYEVSRKSIPAPGANDSYCEKNWMPILDQPNRFIKWCNPTEIVEFDQLNGTCKTVVLDENKKYQFPRDLRGGSQVVNWGDYYIAITHEVNLFRDTFGRKDGKYIHRIVVWDKNWNIIHSTDEFSFMKGDIEFVTGLAFKDNDVLITFGFQDNAAYILRMPKDAFANFVLNNVEENKLIKKLYAYINDPQDPVVNFNIGFEYYKIDQTAAAVSYFLRTTELSDDPILQYKSLILLANCFTKQTRRNFTAEGLIQYAISVIKNRPEAYYFMSEHYMKLQKWRECSLYASLGLEHKDISDDLDIDYPGYQGLLYNKAIGDLNSGIIESAKEQLFDMKYKHNLSEQYKVLVDYHLDTYGLPWSIPYTKNDLQIYKYPFPGIENIDKNYSKHLQDMFILSVMKGKKNGTYLEIGSSHPFETNNTALLEKQFGWKGVSIDIDEYMCELFAKHRNNKVICNDARNVNYKDVLKNYPKVIDYLQIDCNEEITNEVLEKIPFDSYKFRIIQIEHDYYNHGNQYREKARKILSELGYHLLVNDVAFNEKDSYEDWWIHADLIEVPEEMKKVKDINFIARYMMEIN